MVCSLDDFKKEEEENNNKLFHNGEYIVWSEKADTIKPGDIIYLTTSEFEYDCIYGVFMKDLRKNIKVKVEILHEDLDEYVQGKHLNGGCYGYAAAKVVEVLS